MEGKLIVSENGRDRIHELCDDVTRIGRGGEADLNLRDPALSPLHCEIRRTDGGFRLVDLETTEGTQVNGKMVNQRLLQNGDTIRLGAARLTYLGDSAAKPQRPKKPASVALPQLSEGGDADRPRRFYRHEGRGGMGSGLQTVLVLGCLAAVLLLVLWFGTSQASVDGTETANYAEQRIEQGAKEGNRRWIEDAIKMLEALPESSVNDVRRDELIKTGRAHLLLMDEGEKRKIERDRFEAILTDHSSGKYDDAWLRLEIEAFKSRWPDSPYIAELRKALGGTGGETTTGGTPPTLARFDTEIERLNEAVRGKDFKSAFAVLDALESDSEVAAARGDHLSIKRSALTSAFKRHYSEQTQVALDARSKGDADRARRILQQLADTGVEPYATQAKTLLARL